MTYELENETVTTVGRIVRMERKRLNLGQIALSEKLGCTQQNISEIERGLSHPGDKLLDKMIQLFGPDSPINYVNRRGSVAVPVELSGTADMKVAATGTLTAAPQPPVFKRKAEDIWAESAVTSSREAEAEIKEYLPQEYKRYTEYRWDIGRKIGRPDYLSPKLLVEWRFAKESGVSTSARVGMQQLMLYRQALLPKAPRCVLALITPSMDIMRGTTMFTLLEEADILGIEIVFCNDGNAVANIISAYEQEPEN